MHWKKFKHHWDRLLYKMQLYSNMLRQIFLPPSNEVCEGYVFTDNCLSTGSGCLPLVRGWQTPWGRLPLGRLHLGRHPQPPWADTPQPPGQTSIQPPGQTCPLRSACWNTVYKRAVRILLECILVVIYEWFKTIYKSTEIVCVSIRLCADWLLTGVAVQKFTRRPPLWNPNQNLWLRKIPRTRWTSSRVCSDWKYRQVVIKVFNLMISELWFKIADFMTSRNQFSFSDDNSLNVTHREMVDVVFCSGSWKGVKLAHDNTFRNTYLLHQSQAVFKDKMTTSILQLQLRQENIRGECEPPTFQILTKL